MFLAASLALVSALPPATGAETENLYHWAYAAGFGTGAYRIGNERVFIFRIDPRVHLGTLGDTAVELNLRLPFTVGVNSLDINDIISEDISDQLQTVTFVPGLELLIPITPRWLLKPYVQYGWGTDLGGDNSSWIYYSGMLSRYQFRATTWEIAMINGIQWFGHNPYNGASDSFSRLINGFEFGYPLGVAYDSNPLLLRPHVVHYWYFDRLDLYSIETAPTELKQEIEFGMALGTEKPVAVWFFELDRVGIAYRTGSDLDGIRLFISSLFD